jgi:hypothetical protein
MALCSFGHGWNEVMPAVVKDRSNCVLKFSFNTVCGACQVQPGQMTAIHPTTHVKLLTFLIPFSRDLSFVVSVLFLSDIYRHY